MGQFVLSSRLSTIARDERRRKSRRVGRLPAEALSDVEGAKAGGDPDPDSPGVDLDCVVAFLRTTRNDKPTHYLARPRLDSPLHEAILAL